MHSTLIRWLEPDQARVIGAAIAFAIGLLVASPWILSPTGVLEEDIAKVMPPVAGVFGWLLAHAAMRSGWRATLATSIRFDLGAVVVGAFLVAFVGGAGSSSNPGQVLGGTVVLGLIGLAFFGLPMLVVGLVLALIWAKAFRVLATRLGPGAPPRA